MNIDMCKMSFKHDTYVCRPIFVSKALMEQLLKLIQLSLEDNRLHSLPCLALQHERQFLGFQSPGLCRLRVQNPFAPSRMMQPGERYDHT